MKKIICKIENNSIEPKNVILFGKRNGFTEDKFEFIGSNKDIIITYNDKSISLDDSLNLFNNETYLMDLISIMVNPNKNNQLRQEIEYSYHEGGQSLHIPLNSPYLKENEWFEISTENIVKENHEIKYYVLKVKALKNICFDNKSRLMTYVLPKTTVIIEIELVSK